MVQENDSATSGQLTDAIEALLERRTEILKLQEIPITHIWQIPVVINPQLGFMVEINEQLIVSLIMKFDRSVIVNDLVRYVYSQFEAQLIGEDEDDDVVIQ